MGEVDLLRKPVAAGKPVILPPSFHEAESVRADRLTLIRYVSKHPVRVWFHTLRALPTGFGVAAVVLDGPRSRGARRADRDQGRAPLGAAALPARGRRG